MTYRNRDLVRKGHSMIRANEEELDDLMFLVDYYGGKSPAEVYRAVLLELAREKRHEANSLSAQRIAPTLDNNVFTRLRTA